MIEEAGAFAASAHAPSITIRSIYHKEFLSIPSCLQTAVIVPAFKSFWPQSGMVVPLPVAGLNHFRCDPPPRRFISRHPIARSFFVNSL